MDAGDGSPARLDALNVRGKVVLAQAGIGRVFTEATRRGAVGVLAYSLPDYLQPEKNRTSIQFGSVPRDTIVRAWGIVLSYAAREQLRDALARGAVRVRVSTNVQWTPNAVEQAVVAEVRGSQAPEERFVFSAHVQEPGANDNASGVGAQVEMARVAAELLKTRRINPARTITMLWGLEICLEQAATNGWVVKTNPFEGGSDHTPFLRAKKPGLLFWHFTDQFYHTDGDRIEMVSADELRNVGMSALVSALVLTSANAATARDVIAGVERAATTRLRDEPALGAAEVAKGGDAALQRDILETWAGWYRDAVATTQDLEVGGASPRTRSAIAAAQGRVAQVLRASLAQLVKRN